MKFNKTWSGSMLINTLKCSNPDFPMTISCMKLKKGNHEKAVTFTAVSCHYAENIATCDTAGIKMVVFKLFIIICCFSSMKFSHDIVTSMTLFLWVTLTEESNAQEHLKLPY